jgi:hypothetical protein
VVMIIKKDGKRMFLPRIYAHGWSGLIGKRDALLNKNLVQQKR